MGVSTDAILVFGIDLGEELPPCFRDENFYWDDWVNQRLQRPNKPDDTNYRSAAWDAWRAEDKRVHDAFPVDLVYHCSYDYPMFILAVNGTEQRARRGYAVNAAMEPPSLERISAFKSFCIEHGIELKQEPRWLLVSMWG